MRPSGIYNLNCPSERVRLVLSGVSRETRRGLLEVIRRRYGDEEAERVADEVRRQWTGQQR